MPEGLEAGARPPALEIRGLSKEYRRGVPVLRDVDLTVAPTGITAIIGPSGTGKSTLIRCINRLVEPTSGQILFHGVDIARLRGRALREARRRIGMVYFFLRAASSRADSFSYAARLNGVPVSSATLRTTAQSF